MAEQRCRQPSLALDDDVRVCQTPLDCPLNCSNRLLDCFWRSHCPLRGHGACTRRVLPPLAPLTLFARLTTQSVLFETSVGDIIVRTSRPRRAVTVANPFTPAQVDLETELCPILSLNFLKLCKAYKYNFCSFHNVVQDFIAQTGDPTDTGRGGSSIFHLLPRSSPAYQSTPYFAPTEITPKLKHTAFGTLSMAVAGEGEQRGCGSQFFFTLKGDLDYLDGKHAPFGRVIEGEETLQKINEALTDQEGRPLRDIRIRHVIVLGESQLPQFPPPYFGLPYLSADDPFDDPEGLDVPPNSPVPTAKQLASLRVGDEEEIEESGDEEEIAQKRRERDARAQALTLEMVGDLPFADVAPPENVLFVCKLNAVTTSEDLELIFSRFGEILSCEIIRDQKTGDSLQYAFIEFKQREDAERAYLKMDNVLIDDRRIHVDFSQVRVLSFALGRSSKLTLCYARRLAVRLEAAQLLGL